jgi:AraC-like DNA-binding protein
MKDAMFRVGPLVNLPSLIRELGYEPEALFQEAGSNLRQYRDPSHRLNYRSADQLLATCVAVTGRDDLGLLLGERAAPSHLGVTGFLLRAASSARQALMALAEHIDLHDQAVVILYEREGGFTTMNVAIRVEELQALSQISDLAMAVCAKIMLSLCGRDWRPSAVHLERPAPPDPAPYQRYFRAPVYFDAPHSQIIFADHWLDACPRTSDPLLFEHLEQEAMWLHQLHRESVMDAIPGLLRKGLLTQHFSASDIADVMGINERTLHRRLRAGGTTYREELDKVRFAVSCELLAGTELPVNAVASALGYADASGFIRAFRRWSGSSPKTWRSSHQALTH